MVAGELHAVVFERSLQALTQEQLQQVMAIEVFLLERCLLLFVAFVKPYAGDSWCRTRRADACQTSQRKEDQVLLPP